MRRTAIALALSAVVAGPAAAETVLDFPTYQLEESFGPGGAASSRPTRRKIRTSGSS